MSQIDRLRYQISDWSEITQCLSNNSEDLSLRYMEISDEDLEGKLIMVEHRLYGILFSCLVEGKGTLLTSPDPTDVEVMHTFRTEDILMELGKFGFDIYIKREKKLSGDQLDYLMNLNTLGFDKIRILTIVLPYVPHKPKFRQIVVGFMVGGLPKWLRNDYQCPESEYLKAVEDGTAINLTTLGAKKNFDWGFLKDYVLSIDDILAVNS